ncbi:unnamed protein product, partial [Ectocarpus sp. 12 AP-2014]
MEDKHTKFKESIRGIYRLIIVLWCFIGVLTIMGIYLIADPTLSAFKIQTPNETVVAIPVEDDYDKIENG